MMMRSVEHLVSNYKFNVNVLNLCDTGGVNRRISADIIVNILSHKHTNLLRKGINARYNFTSQVERANP